MNEIDLPVGIELVETNDMYGIPCIELAISCATKEIALEYYEKSEFGLKLLELVKKEIQKCQRNTGGNGLTLEALMDECQTNNKK